MTDKSYVTMEQHVCVVCGRPFDSGALLFDRRLRETFDRHTITGWGMCPDDTARRNEGYVALVAIKNVVRNGETVKPGDADRTGAIAHLRATVFTKMFNVSVPEQGFAFVEPAVIEYLQKLAPPDPATTPEEQP